LSGRQGRGAETETERGTEKETWREAKQSPPTYLLLEVLLGANPLEHAEHEARVGTDLVMYVHVDDVVTVVIRGGKAGRGRMGKQGGRKGRGRASERGRLARLSGRCS
jgi:hypothetical protein